MKSSNCLEAIVFVATVAAGCNGARECTDQEELVLEEATTQVIDNLELVAVDAQWHEKGDTGDIQPVRAVLWQTDLVCTDGIEGEGLKNYDVQKAFNRIVVDLQTILGKTLEDPTTEDQSAAWNSELASDIALTVLDGGTDLESVCANADPASVEAGFTIEPDWIAATAGVLTEAAYEAANITDRTGLMHYYMDKEILSQLTAEDGDFSEENRKICRDAASQ
jgi:hypothetical protein